jgi:hypothetical protein
MRQKVLLTLALLLTVLCGRAHAEGVVSPDPFMDRHAAMVDLRDKHFMADFDDPAERAHFMDYKGLLFNVEERLKATVMLLQLHNVFAARDDMQPCVDFVVERFVPQNEEFIAETRDDMRSVEADISGMGDGLLRRYGSDLRNVMAGYVSDVRHLNQRLGATE